MKTAFWLLLNGLLFAAGRSIESDAHLPIYIAYAALINVAYLTGVHAGFKWVGRA